jgi:broad specificity phosphatase PhoE
VYQIGGYDARMAFVLGLRHGEVLNPKGVIYSSLPGFVLSERGHREATDVAAALERAGVVAVYASPLDRAQQTAQALAAATGAEVVTDERLIEWRHWERWAGLRWDELRDSAPDAWTAYTTDPGSVSDGESLDQLADRMASWLGDVEAAHPRGVVVGVTHLEPLRAILLRELGLPASGLFDLQIGHCGMVRLRPDPSAEPVAPREL